MLVHFRILFTPHEENNQKAKVLHLSSLSVFILLIFFFQLFITIFHRVRPGVLGFAANINPERILELTNEQRAKDGLNLLKLDASLSQAAQQKAADMFAKNYWAHYSPTGTSPWWFFKNVNYNYLYAGENLARDFGESDAVVQAWMNSPTHRDNILGSKYKDIGVAVVDGILDGEETTLVVEMFGSRGGVAAVPSQAAATKGASEEVAPIPVYKEQLVLKPQTLLSQPGQERISSPIISSFLLTKSLDVSLLILIMAVLLIDGFLVWKKKLARLGGRNFIHFSFLAIILGIILLTSSGQIL